MDQSVLNSPDETALAARSTQDVFEDHLRLHREGCLEEDLKHNYAEDVLLLTENSVLHGHDGLRISAKRLAKQLPDARFEFLARQVEGEFAFLVWRAQSDRYRVECGADSFMIKDGRIYMQTIHYRLLDRHEHI
ncbi:nuclear transport factor 2 family protein [Microvirga roseola]|uniref:nuclear transport factor 2 family protein n=1 Tax=Microvirga roseola TaxID=2883126 RepID=UPI001E48AA0C|nr:nuclear transport factor 2 family protein [Microvirga roseola]